MKTDTDNAEVTVFPNPSNSTFTISINNAAVQSEFELRVEDLSGRTIYTMRQKIPEGSNTYQFVWNAVNVNNGLYFYKIKLSGDKTFSGKLVKI